MSFADRVQRDLDERNHELWQAHSRGEHDDEYEPDCPRCARGMREAREDEPAFQRGVLR